MIRATAHSDDYVVDVAFDAQPWFEQATSEEIQEFIDCDFGGDYAADAVAIWSAGHDPNLDFLFTYLNYQRYSRKQGFECYVNEDDARAWLAQRGEA